MAVIAFSGCDGSGKTTLALKLKEHLESIGLKVEYHREFEYFILKYLLKILGEKVKMERKKFLGEIKSRSLLDELKYRVWPLLVWLDSNLEMIYLKLLSKKRIVILDRCIIDHLIGFEHLGYLSKQSRNKMLRYSFKPDLIVILDAKPKVMYARKMKTHSYTLDFYRMQRRRYLEIAAGLKIPIIKTDIKTINESVRETIIYSLLYFSRYENLLLHLLSDPIYERNDTLQYIIKLSGLNLNKANIKYLLIETSRNNVEIPVYERLHKIYPDCCMIDKALEIIESKYKDFVSTLIEVTEVFESMGINYVIFKTLPPFRSLPRDIDVLVYEKDKSKAIEALKRRGFRITKTHIIHKEMSLKRNGVEIDLHWKVEWMGRGIINEKSIIQEHNIRKLKEMSIDINIPVPNPTHEFLLVVAHTILQHHYVTLSEVHYIRSLIKNYNLNWNFIFNKIYEKDILDNFNLLMLITIAKDALFYNANIMQKINNNIINYLKFKKTRIISYISILKPVVWLTPNCSFPMRALSFLDSVLTVYRRLRYSLTGRLPYNTPLKEINSIILECKGDKPDRI